MQNKFLQTVDLEIDDYIVTFRVAGMTEFYEVIDLINKYTAQNKSVLELQSEIDVLVEKADKTDEEISRLNSLSEKISHIYITGDTVLRRFFMELAINVSQNGESGDAQTAKWFIDTRSTETLASLLQAVRPDIEKNLQSQS